jgi:hypothetical protein
MVALARAFPDKALTHRPTGHQHSGDAEMMIAACPRHHRDHPSQNPNAKRGRGRCGAEVTLKN